MKKETFKSSLGESYIKVTLDNGLSVYIMEKSQYTSSFAIFGTKFGSVDTHFSRNGEEVTVPDGIAHYLEHKLFESEEGDAFSLYAKTGASANAFTSFDRTCYLFSCSDKFYENLDILLDLVQTPYFTEKTVAKEQGIIGQEIRMYDDSPAWRVMFNMLQNMYENHPVRVDIAGTVETIADIDYKKLYDCYETFYNPSNMFICIVGNVDTNKVLEKITSSVKIENRVSFERILPQEPTGVINNYVEQQLAVAMPVFCLGYKEKIKADFVDLESKIGMSMLLEIICGDASPLYADLVKKGLINDEFSNEYFNGKGYACVMFEGESQNPKEVERLIKNEIRRLKENGIDEKMFSAVKKGMYGDAVRRFNSVEGMCMQLVEGAVFDYDIFEETDILKNITKAQVSKLLDVFDEENTVLSVILPKEN